MTLEEEGMTAAVEVPPALTAAAPVVTGVVFTGGIPVVT